MSQTGVALTCVVVLLVLTVLWFTPPAHTQDLTRSLDDADDNLPLSGSLREPRKFVAGVVCGDRASDRFAKFSQAWQTAWPELEFYVQQSFLNHQGLRGLGVFASQLLIMEEMLMRDPDSFDYVLIFEDDAMPFDDVTWPLELNQQLDKMERRQGDVLFMGLHHIHSETEDGLRRPMLEDIESELPNGIHNVHWGWGAYAYVVRSRFLPNITQSFREGVQGKNSTGNAPDYEIWLSLRASAGSGGHVSVPLLVDHDVGFSSTWGKDRNKIQGFQGFRDWWNHHIIHDWEKKPPPLASPWPARLAVALGCFLFVSLVVVLFRHKVAAFGRLAARFNKQRTTTASHHLL